MKKKMKKKKMNNKGFTLIELLAVITIMGILMMVAIPAVTRTIENARRDSFNTIAKSYMDAVRNAWTADNIVCYYNSTWTVASGVAGSESGTSYYFPICSGDVANFCKDYTTNLPHASIASSTQDLMESGGKSSFGNGDMFGVVRITKKDIKEVVTNGVVTTPAKTTIKYDIIIGDTGKHGYETFKTDKEMTRSNVLTALPHQPTNAIDGKATSVSISSNFCKLS